MDCKEKEEGRVDVPLFKGKGLLVLVASFFALFFNTSLNFTVGVLHIALVEEFPEEDITTISWMGALFSSMFALAGFTGSFIISKCNARVCVMVSGVSTLVGFSLSSFITNMRYLFITYSIIAGSGQAMCFAGVLVYVSYYFREKTSIATGIAVSGCGVSSFVFPPLSQYLIDTYGLRGAFLLLGGLGLQASVFGALMTPTKYEIGLHSKRCFDENRNNHNVPKTLLEKLSDVQEKLIFFTSKQFWLFLVCSFSFNMSVSAVYLFLPDYFKHMGSTTQEAAIILSVAGAAGAVSRFALGFLASVVDVAIVFGGMFGTIGVATFFIKFMTNLGGKMVYSALLGFYTGACWSLQYTFLVEIHGLRNISIPYGVTMLIGGIGYFLGPPLAEMLVVWFHDYYLAYVFAGSGFLVASMSTLLIKVSKNTLALHTVNIQFIGETEDIYKGEKEKSFIGENEKSFIGEKDKLFIGEKDKLFIECEQPQPIKTFLSEKDELCVSPDDTENIKDVQNETRSLLDSQDPMCNQ